MILIFVPKKTARIIYIMQIMMENILGCSFTITEDREYYAEWKGIKFAYSSNPMKGGIWFQSTSLLTEQDIHFQNLTKTLWKEYQLFYPVESGAMNIDPFAISFYLITRYEEYLEDIPRDEHGRFSVKSSISYQNGFHHKPMVEILSYSVGDILKQHFPELKIAERTYQIRYTYDVDIAYHYYGKSPIRHIGAIIKSLINRNLTDFKNLIKVLYRRDITDNFDTFSQHKQRAEDTENRPIHFILTAPFGRYDKNINPKGKAFDRLIKELSKYSDIGLHPSYYSSVKNDLIKVEKKELERRIGSNVTQSRQHYLRFQIPETFEALYEAGIRKDFSMGWHDEVGFRASTSHIFPFYDLKRESILDLQMYPLAIMDGALYKSYSVEERNGVVESIVDIVKEYGGEMIVLIHNTVEKDWRYLIER